MKPHKILVALVIITSLYAYKAQRLEADPPVIVPPTFEQSIQRIFGSQTKVALAVFKAESQNNEKAINYNCIYGGKSTFCKPQDVYKAHSVDCGAAQINVKGKVCPPELLTKEGSIPYIEKIYKTQGLKAWVAYSNKSFQRYLES